MLFSSFFAFLNLLARPKHNEETEFLKNIPCPKGLSLIDDSNDSFFWRESSISYLQYEIYNFINKSPVSPQLKSLFSNNLDILAFYVYFFRHLSQSSIISRPEFHKSPSHSFLTFLKHPLPYYRTLYEQLISLDNFPHHSYYQTKEFLIPANDHVWIAQHHFHYGLGFLFSKLLTLKENFPFDSFSILSSQDQSTTPVFTIEKNSDLISSLSINVSEISKISFDSTHAYYFLPFWNDLYFIHPNLEKTSSSILFN